MVALDHLHAVAEVGQDVGQGQRPVGGHVGGRGPPRLVEAGYLEQVLQACSTTEWAGRASPADVATYRALALSNVLADFGDRMQMIERDHLNALYLAMEG